MPRPINVYFLPAEFEPEQLNGGTAVIVDVLRASTTITFALANGAESVIPCGSVEEALAIQQRQDGGKCLLGGERGGVKIDGFDLSNSPDDYSPNVVGGKTIGFTTTNGTRALLRSKQADEILIGAFVNLSTVVVYLLDDDRPIHIVCAGTDGHVTGEDVLFAGALVTRLAKRTDADFVPTDAARIAASHWTSECRSGSVADVESAMQKSRGGKNLLKLGYAHDIATAAAIDSVQTLGVVDSDGSIRVARLSGRVPTAERRK